MSFVWECVAWWTGRCMPLIRATSTTLTLLNRLGYSSPCLGDVLVPGVCTSPELVPKKFSLEDRAQGAKRPRDRWGERRATKLRKLNNRVATLKTLVDACRDNDLDGKVFASLISLLQGVRALLLDEGTRRVMNAYLAEGVR